MNDRQPIKLKFCIIKLKLNFIMHILLEFEVNYLNLMHMLYSFEIDIKINLKRVSLNHIVVTLMQL
jgi:hypothetical protein